MRIIFELFYFLIIILRILVLWSSLFGKFDCFKKALNIELFLEHKKAEFFCKILSILNDFYIVVIVDGF